MAKTRTKILTSKLHTWLTLISTILIASCISFSALAQDNTWAPNQQIGSTLPAFTLPDSTGNPKEISSLFGSQGMLLLFNRSTDW